MLITPKHYLSLIVMLLNLMYSSTLLRPWGSTGGCGGSLVPHGPRHNSRIFAHLFGEGIITRRDWLKNGSVVLAACHTAFWVRNRLVNAAAEGQVTCKHYQRLFFRISFSSCVSGSFLRSSQQISSAWTGYPKQMGLGQVCQLLLHTPVGRHASLTQAVRT